MAVCWLHCRGEDALPTGWRRGAVVSAVRRVNEVNARHTNRLLDSGSLERLD